MPDISLTSPAGSVVVEIGNTAVALCSSDPSFRQVLRNRYAAFVKPLLRVHSQFNVELIELPEESGRDESLQVKIDRGLWTFHRGDFTAEWDPETGLGRIRQHLNPYSADTVLRIVHSLILARQGGFLLHSASAIRNGSAFLFSGLSGAGKTTISRLAPADVTLLTDEISYIRPDGKGYRAFGTPFAGELATLGENVSAPLATLFFLEKGAENRSEAIAPEEGIRRLLRNILFFAEDSELVNLVFQTACDFVEKVQVRKLIFTRDERAWKTVGIPGK